MEDGLRDRVAGGTVDVLLVDAAWCAARLAARTRPSPTGASIWSDEEIGDLVLEAIGQAGTDQVVLAANAAANDNEFIGWLRTIVRSTLDARARHTPSGRVIRATEDALRQDPSRFVLEQGRWRLARDERAPGCYQGDAPLVTAAWTVETTTVRISEGATKTPPMAYRRDIRSVCEVVLELGGPLTKLQLANVLAQRFNVLFGARFDYLNFDTEDGEAELPADAAEQAFDDVDDKLAAGWMLRQLTGEERRVLGILVAGAGVRELAISLGCSKHRATLVSNRIHEKLRRLADLTAGDGQAATARLLDLVGQHEVLRHSPHQDGPLDAD